MLCPIPCPDLTMAPGGLYNSHAAQQAVRRTAPGQAVEANGHQPWSNAAAAPCMQARGRAGRRAPNPPTFLGANPAAPEHLPNKPQPPGHGRLLAHPNPVLVVLGHCAARTGARARHRQRARAPHAPGRPRGVCPGSLHASKGGSKAMHAWLGPGVTCEREYQPDINQTKQSAQAAPPCGGPLSPALCNHRADASGWAARHAPYTGDLAAPAESAGPCRPPLAAAGARPACATPLPTGLACPAAAPLAALLAGGAGALPCTVPGAAGGAGAGARAPSSTRRDAFCEASTRPRSTLRRLSIGSVKYSTARGEAAVTRGACRRVGEGYVLGCAMGWARELIAEPCSAAHFLW